jgi:hypothetical protein
VGFMVSAGLKTVPKLVIAASPSEPFEYPLLVSLSLYMLPTEGNRNENR